MIIMFILGVVFSETECVRADELSSIVDFDSIQRAIDESNVADMEISFFDVVESMLNGENIFDKEKRNINIGELLLKEIRGTISDFRGLVVVVIIAAVFANFASGLKNMQVAETGFYVVYIVLFTLVTGNFKASLQLSLTVLENILNFIRALVPSYCIAVAMGIGSTTSALLYEGILILISVVELVLVKMVVPGITFYMMLSVAGNISKENVISRLTGLLETAIKWTLRTIPGVVFGIGTIQGMLTPVIDGIKRTATVKTLSAIPGVGNIFNSAGETVLGTGILLKNSVGLAGTIVLFILGMLPMLKLFVYILVFKCAGAVIQPIADDRVVKGIDAAANAIVFLAKTVFSGMISFAIAIVIVVIQKG